MTNQNLNAIEENDSNNKPSIMIRKALLYLKILKNNILIVIALLLFVAFSMFATARNMMLSLKKAKSDFNSNLNENFNQYNKYGNQ